MVSKGKSRIPAIIIFIILLLGLSTLLLYYINPTSGSHVTVTVTYTVTKTFLVRKYVTETESVTETITITSALTSTATQYVTEIITYRTTVTSTVTSVEYVPVVMLLAPLSRLVI